MSVKEPRNFADAGSACVIADRRYRLPPSDREALRNILHWFLLGRDRSLFVLEAYQQ